MTVLLDAYAVIALLRGEPAAKEIRPLLEHDTVLVHPLNLGEVIDRMARLDGADPDEVEGDVALLDIHTSVLDEVDLIDAGRWRARYYRRTERPVSLADCVAGVSAVSGGIPLATSDQHCADMVWEEGGDVIALPDSTGQKPAAARDRR